MTDLKKKTIESSAVYNVNDNEQGKFLYVLTNIGEALLSEGAEIHRVEDTLLRLAKAYGAVQTNIFVITSSIVITIMFEDGNTLTQTKRITKYEETDFTKLEQLNELSRECVANPVSPDELEKNFKKIIERKNGNKRFVAGSIISAISFTLFFGGTFADAIAAGAFSLIICLFQIKLSSLFFSKVTFNIFVSFVVGYLICIIEHFLPGLHSDKIIIGDIMLLIPGIAMTNSIRDIILGDTISGTMRLVESLLWAISLAGGFMMAIWLGGVL